MRERRITEFYSFEDDLVKEEDTNTFCDYFTSLAKETCKKNAEIIRCSDIEKSYYYQILKGKRNPSRDKVICLCIGAGMTEEETSYALILNENSPLYLKKRRDRVIAFALKEKLSVTETNMLLDELNEKTLQ